MPIDATRSDPNAVPWTLRDMLRAGVAAVALVALGAGQLAAIASLLHGSLQLDQGGLLLVVGVLALEGLVVVPVWAWGPGKHGGGWRSLGLRGFRLPRAIGHFCLALVVILLINGLWGVVARALGLEGQAELLPLFGDGLDGLALALLLGAVIVPFAEELFFRGYLYAGLRQPWGPVVAALVSSVLFALLHLTPSVLLPIFCMSLVLTWLYERSDSLWPSIALHGSINGLAFLVAYLMQIMGDTFKSA